MKWGLGLYCTSRQIAVVEELRVPSAARRPSAPHTCRFSVCMHVGCVRGGSVLLRVRARTCVGARVSAVVAVVGVSVWVWVRVRVRV